MDSKYFDNHLAIDLEQWRISGVEMKTCDNILASDWQIGEITRICKNNNNKCGLNLEL